jgi:phosphoribosylformylglycinamidine synthase
VRNLVCVGTDPERIAILDNFCWPGCRDAEQLGTLVRAAAACYDGAKAYRTPFISGKDSLNNQFATEDGRTIRIPPTLLISGFGIVPDVAQCVTMDLKTPGNLLLVVGRTTPALGGSHVATLPDVEITDPALPMVDLEAAPATARAVHRAINAGLVRAAHDPSEGGLLVGAAEMAIAANLGLTLDLLTLPAAGSLSPFAACFAETPGRYLLEVRRDDLDAIDRALRDIPYAVVGEVTAEPRFRVERHGVDLAVSDLRDAWQAPLDW